MIIIPPSCWHSRGIGAGHKTSFWAALRFGCNAQRCENFDEVDKIYQYKVVCQGCGSVSHYQRKVGIVQELERNPNTTKFYCKKCKSRNFLLEAADNF